MEETTGPSRTGITESWNGTSWTEVADLNTARMNGAGSAGTQTSALFLLEKMVHLATACNCRRWNGSAWTEVADMATARSRNMVLQELSGNICIIAGYNGNTANVACYRRMDSSSSNNKCSNVGLI